MGVIFAVALMALYIAVLVHSKHEARREAESVERRLSRLVKVLLHERDALRREVAELRSRYPGEVEMADDGRSP